jgi:S-adenosylmethionine-diacylgycerolhomoserine-N-methlytransferase
MTAMPHQPDAKTNMDRMYRHQRYIYDVTRRYYLLGRLQMIQGLNAPADGTVLEIGCGTAWNLIQAAAINPKARYYGFDVSAEMLITARANIARSPHRDRIIVGQGDATSFTPARVFGTDQLPGGTFDRVFASYTLSMIPQWPQVLEQAVTSMAPTGSLHIVDFGAASRLPAPVRRAVHAWLAQFDVTPRTTLKTALTVLAARHNLHCVHSELYRGYAQYAVLTAQRR